MEMPDVEGEVDAAAAAAAAPPGPDGGPAPAAAPNPAKQLRARRELLRNAMELAVQGSAVSGWSNHVWESKSCQARESTVDCACNRHS